jgi:hypothetical protein
MKPVITNLDNVLTTIDAPAREPRLVPKKLSLRVSGSRIGTLARPATDGVIAAAAIPATRMGMRMHDASRINRQGTKPPRSEDELVAPAGADPASSGSSLLGVLGALAVHLPARPLTPDDYATAEDYE